MFTSISALTVAAAVLVAISAVSVDATTSPVARRLRLANVATAAAAKSPYDPRSCKGLARSAAQAAGKPIEPQSRFGYPDAADWVRNYEFGCLEARQGQAYARGDGDYVSIGSRCKSVQGHREDWDDRELQGYTEGCTAGEDVSNFLKGDKMKVVDDVNFRRTPGWRSKPSSDVIRELNPDTVCVVADSNGAKHVDNLDWIKMTCAGKVGWVARRSIKTIFLEYQEHDDYFNTPHHANYWTCKSQCLRTDTNVFTKRLQRCTSICREAGEMWMMGDSAPETYCFGDKFKSSALFTSVALERQIGCNYGIGLYFADSFVTWDNLTGLKQKCVNMCGHMAKSNPWNLDGAEVANKQHLCVKSCVMKVTAKAGDDENNHPTAPLQAVCNEPIEEEDDRVGFLVCAAAHAFASGLQCGLYPTCGEWYWATYSP